MELSTADHTTSVQTPLSLLTGKFLRSWANKTQMTLTRAYHSGFYQQKLWISGVGIANWLQDLHDFSKECFATCGLRTLWESHISDPEFLTFTLWFMRVAKLQLWSRKVNNFMPGGLHNRRKESDRNTVVSPTSQLDSRQLIAFLS